MTKCWDFNIFQPPKISSTGPKSGPEQVAFSRQEGFSETSQNTYFERILSAARQRQQTLGADLVLAEE